MCLDLTISFPTQVALVWGGKTSYARMLFYVVRTMVCIYAYNATDLYG